MKSVSHYRTNAAIVSKNSCHLPCCNKGMNDLNENRYRNPHCLRKVKAFGCTTRPHSALRKWTRRTYLKKLNVKISRQKNPTIEPVFFNRALNLVECGRFVIVVVVCWSESVVTQRYARAETWRKSVLERGVLPSSVSLPFFMLFWTM